MNDTTFNNKTLLLLIDLQNAIDHPSWGRRNNLDAEKNIIVLLNLWREKHWPICHIRHDSTDPNSHYRPGQHGNEFKAEFTPLPREKVIAKKTNSAFIGTELEAYLRTNSYRQLVIVGVITNNSVEAKIGRAHV